MNMKINRMLRLMSIWMTYWMSHLLPQSFKMELVMTESKTMAKNSTKLHFYVSCFAQTSCGRAKNVSSEFAPTQLTSQRSLMRSPMKHYSAFHSSFLEICLLPLSEQGNMLLLPFYKQWELITRVVKSPPSALWNLHWKQQISRFQDKSSTWQHPCTPQPLIPVPHLSHTQPYFLPHHFLKLLRLSAC